MMDALQAIYDFFTVGLYQFWVDAYSWYLVKATTWAIEAEIFWIMFAWDVAKEVLESFQFTEKFESAIGLLDTDTRNMLAFFNVFEFIDIVFKAYAARFVLNFMNR